MNKPPPRRISVFAMLFLLLVTFAACTGVADRTYWGQSREVLEDVRTLLIQADVCKDSQKRCSGYLFRAPISGGFELTVIGVLDQHLLDQIKQLATRKLKSTPGMKKVNVVAYAGDGHVPSENTPPKEIGLLFREEFRN